MAMIATPLLRPALLRPTFLRCRFSCYTHRLYSDSKTAAPLRILFAGSDDFSIVSLNALHREHVNRPSLIASIDVLCREDGRTGRKRDILKEGSPNKSSCA
ncbi:hypothetical protein K440DRAFT_626100 [Wilcoxina mikolae CBS 423.85]|nr:hypothetical protein K440DRAFT_626100 [Wilcoxina mikolae CBS 423.85]